MAHSPTCVDQSGSTYPHFHQHLSLASLTFELNAQTRVAICNLLSRPASVTGLKGSAKGESPMAPFVVEMARVVIGQKEDDTSIITPNLDSVSVRRRVAS
jgi:hypothetical protein